jgi:hypothetical protein
MLFLQSVLKINKDFGLKLYGLRFELYALRLELYALRLKLSAYKSAS